MDSISATEAADERDALHQILQRRLFLLNSTLWNPESDLFGGRALAWQDQKQPRQYQTALVCATCALIYHSMDSARFRSTKGRIKEVAERLVLNDEAKWSQDEEERETQVENASEEKETRSNYQDSA